MGRCVRGVLMASSQTYSVITERHWRHCLGIWVLWPLGVGWLLLCYLPELYSSKLSKTFLRIHQLKLQRSSALTVNSPCSVCCKCLSYVATIPYVCGLLIWKLMELDVVPFKTCCTGKAAEGCGVTHMCVHTPAYTAQSFLSKAMLVLVWVYAVKEVVLWGGLAASRLFCPKYSLPHLSKS